MPAQIVSRACAGCSTIRWGRAPPGRAGAPAQVCGRREGLSSPITELLKQRTLEQIAKPGVIYPSKGEIETELGRNANYLAGIADLFKKYGIKGWEEPYERAEGAVGRL